jgi:hypothetical protein
VKNGREILEIGFSWNFTEKNAQFKGRGPRKGTIHRRFATGDDFSQRSQNLAAARTEPGGFEVVSCHDGYESPAESQ